MEEKKAPEQTKGNKLAEWEEPQGVVITEKEAKQFEEAEKFKNYFSYIKDRAQINCLYGWKKSAFSKPQQAQSITAHTQAVWWNIQTMCTAVW